MSFDIAAMREALAAKIESAYQRQSWSCNVYAYPPSDPVGRCVLVNLAADAVRYHQTFGASGVAALELEIEVRLPAGSVRDIDALKECDAVLGVGVTGSLFDAISSDNYALPNASGWAFVLTAATGPELVGTVDGVQSWYSIRFRASLARSKGT